MADGYTLFCDDVRHEIGGKTTYVGRYSQVMYVPSFPFLHPKLVLAVNYIESQIDSPVTPVDLLVYLPGDQDDKPSLTAKLSFEDEKIGKLPDDLPAGAANHIRAETFIEIAPFKVDGPGAVKVRVRRGDEIVRLGQLQVRLRAEKSISNSDVRASEP